MTPRAIIFDVYRTLLDVGSPPMDADALWIDAGRDVLPGCRLPSLPELSERCNELVAMEHQAARALGIEFPEVVWADIFTRALPSAATLPSDTLAHLILRHQKLLRTTRIAPGAAEFLRRARDMGIVLGIASNAQAYTVTELRECLEPVQFAIGSFDPSLTIWSFDLGFSKPDPRIFRILDSRLRHRGIGADEVLMLGDRLDNDIRPAAAQGWRTWHLCGNGRADENAGPWSGAIERILPFGLSRPA